MSRKIIACALVFLSLQTLAQGPYHQQGQGAGRPGNSAGERRSFDSNDQGVAPGTNQNANGFAPGIFAGSITSSGFSGSAGVSSAASGRF